MKIFLKEIPTMNKFSNIKYLFLLIPLVCWESGVALAQKNNLHDIVLAVGSEQSKEMVMGNTGGSYSLASIANRDRDKNPCMGYGDPQPDHIITLKGDFSRLKMLVNSGGNDTTLVVKEIETQTIRCGFGQNGNKDAVIEGSNWSAGIYHVWVGSVVPNMRSPYRLNIEH